MRKIFYLVATFAFIFFLGMHFLSVDANDQPNLTMIDGASIRTSGVQGLRFSAVLPEGYDDAEHGFYMIYGEASIADLQNALSSEQTLLNGKTIKKTQISGYNLVTRQFSVVLTGIPTNGYGQDITVIAYIKVNGEEILSSSKVTRNVADIARTMYTLQPTEYTGDVKTVIDSIVETRRIKVTSENGNKAYYTDFSDITLVENDTLELTRGTYVDKLTVNVDGVSVFGANANIAIDSNGQRNGSSFDESIYTAQWIELSDGVDNFSVNGLQFTNERGIHMMGTHDEVNIRYSKFTTTGNWSIRDNSSSCEVSNLTINNNYFHSSESSYSRDIFLWGIIHSTEISSNYFKSNLTTISGDDYAIRFMRYGNGSTIDIYQNTFNKLGSSYLIDIGYSHGSSGTREIANAVNVNIEDNWMTPHFETCLGGNGIRVMYLSDNSCVSIVRNHAFRTSPYYNAILLTTANAANSNLSASNLVVEIIHNKFYAEALENVVKPDGRNEVSTRYTRIGLGIPTDCDLSISNNYFGSSTSRYAYTLNNSASAASNTNQMLLTTNSAAESDNANAGYTTMLADFDTKVQTYLSEMGSLSAGINAYYGGVEVEDISLYIDSFDENDSQVFEIQNGQLVFIGNKLYFLRIAVNNQVYASSSQVGPL